jgi:hypothetical protein
LCLYRHRRSGSQIAEQDEVNMLEMPGASARVGSFDAE